MRADQPQSGADVANDELLAEIVRRLVEAYQPERIYLFGSKARGDAGPDSDYDIMVVVPDDASPDRRKSETGYRAVWSLYTSADIIVWPLSEFDARRHLKASLPSTVVREGVLLHAA